MPINNYGEHVIVHKNLNTTPWVRPFDWNVVPQIGVGEQVIYLQFAVFNDDSNYFACLCSGAYTVDTGDGVITNVASNIKFEYKINYANVTKVCNRGYKVAQIKITPQAGQNLTEFSLYQQHSALTTNRSTNLLEIVGNAPYVTTTALNNKIGGNSYPHYMIENIDISVGAVNGIAAIAYNLTSLRKFNVISTVNITNYSVAFTSSGLIVIDDSIIKSSTIAGSISSSFASTQLRVFNPSANMDGVTLTSSCFGASGNLSKCVCNGLKISFTIANHKMSASALNELFTSLGTPSTTQTVTVTGNPGAGTCDTSIATAKNWTVVII